MSIMGYPADVVARAEQVWDRLQTVTSEYEAIEIMRGESRSVFAFIDEKPGYFPRRDYDGTTYGYGWMYLRRARNNPDSHLFDVLVP